MSIEQKWDFLIVVALHEEYSAVLRAFKGEFEQNQFPKSAVGKLVAIEGRVARGRRFRGLVARPDSMGRLSAAILTAHLLSLHKIGLVGLTGIAGGLRGRQTARSEQTRFPSLGDVVFADGIVDLVSTPWSKPPVFQTGAL